MKPNLGDVIAEKYRLDRVLGEGGMSMVFAAANVLTGKPVAIKWLQPEVIRDEEQSQRLLREAQVTSNIDHPNVVNVFDVGRHEGALFLVMELLHGEPLSELLMRGPQDPVEFVRLMMPVLRGVHAAHRAGVVHRDLKPDNIFMCRDPHGEAREPKVLDFGISKLAGDMLLPGQELTREGTVFGTPQYMAPEQMRDARIADARSDVYALGVIFYRAFSNEYPYDADTLTALAIRIVEGNAPPLHELCPQLDRGLSDLIMRALSLAPDQRFQSVAELGTALEAYADGMLFVPASLERESATWLRRDSTAVMLADGTPSVRRHSPPPPPRSNSGALALARVTTGSQRATTALDARDLVSAPELQSSSSPLSGSTSTRNNRLSIPPPPPPTSTRPNRGLEVVVDDGYATQRVDRWSSRRQTLVIGTALFAIGSIAPAGWQLLEKERGALHSNIGEARPRALVSGKGANVLAAMERERSAKELAEAPRAGADLGARASTPPERQAAGAAPDEALVAAGTTDELSTPEGVSGAAVPAQELAAPPAIPSGLAAPTARPDQGFKRRSLPARPSTAATAPAPSETANAASGAEPGTPPVEALPVTQSERNPYLRR